jgi:AAHS family 4-hydroxybenzoate transporter-like MFS transporter
MPRRIELEQAGTAPATPPHRRVAGLCFLVLCLEGYDNTALGFATPALVEAWHVAAAYFTPAITLGSVGMLVGSLIAGLLGDRLGRKPVLIGCVAIFGVFSLFTARSTNLGSLTLLRLLTCLGLGGAIPPAIALITDFAPPVRPRGLVMLTSGGVVLGSTFGGFAARELVTRFGWEAIFVAAGLLPLLVIPPLVAFLPESDAIRQDAASAVRASPGALFRHQLAVPTLVLWGINFCSVSWLFVILLWLPALLHSLGHSPAASILVTTIFIFGGILGFIGAAAIVDRVGAERVTAWLLLLGASCLVLIGSVRLPYALLCLVAACLGIGSAGQIGINTVSGALYPAPIRATGVGWALGVGRLGQVAGPLGAGLLLGLGWDPRAILLAVSVPAFCAAIGMALLARGRPHQV